MKVNIFRLLKKVLFHLARFILPKSGKMEGNYVIFIDLDHSYSVKVKREKDLKLQMSFLVPNHLSCAAVSQL